MATLAENYKSQLEGPMVAGDIKSIKLNIAKLVKLQGGTPETKASSFFSASKAQENEYESKFLIKSKSPTQMGKSSSGGSGDSSGGGFFDSIGSFFKLLLTGGLIAGAIAAIGKMLENPETRETIRKFLVDAFESIFNGVRSIIEFAGSALSDPKVIDSIIGVFQELGKQLINIIIGIDKSLTESFNIPGGLLTVLGVGGLLYVALTSAIAAVGAFVTAANLAAARLAGGVFGGGGPGTNKTPRKGGAKRRGWMRGLGTAVGIGLIGTGIQYYLEQGESEEDARRLAQEDIDNQAKQSLGPGEEIVPKKPEGMRGSEIADRATSVAVGASLLKSGLSGLPSTPSTAPSTAPSSKVAGPFDHLEGKKLTPGGSVRANREIEKNKTLWEKIARVMKRAYEKGVSTEMLRKIFKKFGFSVAAKLTGALAGVVAAPFSVGASLLITALGVYMLASDVIDLYDWFIEYEKELDAYEKASSPTPVAADPTSVSPSPAPAAAAASMTAAAAPKMAPGGNAKRGGSTSPTPSGGGAIPSGGQVDPEKTTFADLTVEQQDAFLAEQRKQEGFKPGSLSYDLNNPGNMLYSPWQRKYGGELDTTGRGVGTVKGKFAKFPTLQDGVNAQRALWMSPKYSSLPLDKALNLWVTGNKDSDMDINMRAKNTNYKSGIYAAIGGAPTTTLASASPSTPSSGSSLTQAQSALSTLAMNNSSGGQTIINAPTNNSMMSSPSSSGGIISAFNDDMMKYLLIRTA